jgi:hypothetical protein
MELKKIVSQLKNASQELLGQVKEIDSQIAELAKWRDKLTSGIVSKVDFLAYLRSHIIIETGYFGKDIAHAMKDRRDFGTLERNLNAGKGFQGLYLLTAFAAPVEMTEKAIYFYFADVILERLAKYLDALDWPEDAIPVSVRREQLLEIEQKTADLYQQRAELVSMLAEAGIIGV